MPRMDRGPRRSHYVASVWYMHATDSEGNELTLGIE
jgi:hypothetical protein